MLSVVVPTYNRAPVLARCLDALAAQEPAADEVVVVDDGSTDATPAVLAERGVGAGRPARRTAGARRPRTAGVEAARGDVVLFLDDDVIADARAWSASTRRTTPRRPEPHEALLGHVTWAPEIEVTRHMHWLEHGGPLFAYDEIDDPRRRELADALHGQRLAQARVPRAVRRRSCRSSRTPSSPTG